MLKYNAKDCTLMRLRRWFVGRDNCVNEPLFAYDVRKESVRFFMADIRYAQTNHVDQGELRIQVLAGGASTPIDNAKISISYSGDPESTVEEVNTDVSGLAEAITLDAPPLEYSMEPSSEYELLQTIL